jgi:phosphohistidine phosphatase
MGKMKRLFFIRHAKSSWRETGLTDRERPLNLRGNRDAHFMANLLKEKKIKPDIIISSDAVRAKATAYIFADTLKYPREEISEELDLYLASIHDFLTQINSLDDSAESCFVFSHNPGISGVIFYLTGYERVDMPTCAVYGIEFDIQSWREVREGIGKPIIFEYPKKYFKDE